MRNVIGFGIALLAVVSSTASAQTRVTNVAPANVQVQAGGSAVPLTLDGLGLAAVTSVRLLVGGQSVSGLNGVLRGAAQTFTGGASRLTVDLSAARTVPAGTYQLELVAGAQRILAPVSITVLNSLPQRLDQPTGGLPLPTQPKVAGTVTIPTASVTSASPATVTLRAGGPAQTVALNGSLLNQVVGAYVQRNGNRVLSGLRAELLASTDPARREVRLSAYGTTGPWGVPLDLVLEYTIGSSPIRAANPMPTPVQITATAPPNVDLSISSCTFEKFPQSFYARATIRNTGSEGVAFQTNQVIARAMFGSNFDVRAEGGGVFVVAGGSAEVKAQFSTLPAPGSHHVTWTVDPTDLVAESNATNNEKTCTLVVEVAPPTPTPPMSDVAITTLTAQPISGPPGTQFVFTVVVKNIGTANVGSMSTGVEVRCTVDGGQFAGNNWAWFGSIEPGKTYGPYQIRTSQSLAPGTKVLECTVDPYNKLTESTRNNNARSLVFTVTSK